MSMNNYYEHYRFFGSHREVGRQHGEVLRGKIKEHINLIISQAETISCVGKESLLESTYKSLPYVEKYTPGFVEEIKGLAEGAEISFREAMLLQMRQEAVYSAVYGKNGNECTSFAVGGEYTKDGRVYSGQNADLAGDFESISSVVTFAVTGKPTVMMLVPAGQISYHGINSEGMSVNCNFLPCMGWQKGLPRYLFSRMMLEQPTFDGAIEVLYKVKERAASRNILLADYRGYIANHEVTPEAIGRLEATGLLVHANHFNDPYMKQFQAAGELEIIDSEWREKRLIELMEYDKGHIDADLIKTMLRDHKTDQQTGKFSICMHESEETEYYHTVASIINDLEDCSFEITKGNPCHTEYKKYKLIP